MLYFISTVNHGFYRTLLFSLVHGMQMKLTVNIVPIKSLDSTAWRFTPRFRFKEVKRGDMRRTSKVPPTLLSIGTHLGKIICTKVSNINPSLLSLFRKIS